MKKKLTLWILLLPSLGFAQIMQNGTISIPLGKKKANTEQQDTTKTQPTYSDDDDDQPPPQKVKKEKHVPTPAEEQQEEIDLKRGLFKGLFHAGINAAQVDGDGYYGYNYLGAEAGVGAMIRFHKYMSVSMELNYIMKGAKQKFVPNVNAQTPELYKLQWDYVEVPFSFNVHDKKLVMFSAGLSIAALVRYKEQDQQGQEISNNPTNGQPNKFDFCAFGALHFIIKNQFAIGAKFSYSLIKIRGQIGTNKVNGQFNNCIALDFMYILDPLNLKKH